MRYERGRFSEHFVVRFVSSLIGYRYSKELKCCAWVYQDAQRFGIKGIFCFRSFIFSEETRKEEMDIEPASDRVSESNGKTKQNKINKKRTRLKHFIVCIQKQSFLILILYNWFTLSVKQSCAQEFRYRWHESWRGKNQRPKQQQQRPNAAVLLYSFLLFSAVPKHFGLMHFFSSRITKKVPRESAR